MRAVERLSACASVFAQMNSTPAKPLRDHVLDGVASASADAHHLDDGAFLRFLVDDFKHGSSSFSCPGCPALKALSIGPRCLP